MKVLNLYSGMGGNRRLWPKDCEVTAVEIIPEIADIYKDNFPNDTVVITDAHKYLSEHYEGFDFIWTSPPCPTHSRIRNVAGVGSGQNKPVFPDMKLYEEIIFLGQISNTSGTTFNGKWVVENVASYYEPLIKPYECGRHYFWANFVIAPFKIESRGHMETVEELIKIKGFEANKEKILAMRDVLRSDTLLRNSTEPTLGLHVFNCAFRMKQQTFEP